MTDIIVSPVPAFADPEDIQVSDPTVGCCDDDAAPGEESSPFVATFVAAVLIFAAPIQEEFVAPVVALSAEETGFLPALIPDNRLSTISVSEEFAGSLPLEETATPQTFFEPVWISWISWSVGEEFGGAHPTEDFGSFVFTHVDLPIPFQSSTEDVFEGSLPLEETAPPQTFLEPVWISWSVDEEFGGAHPVEEFGSFGPFVLTIVKPPIPFQSSTEEVFPGSLPLEETATPQIFLEPVWIWSFTEASFVEEFPSALALEEYPLTQDVRLEPVSIGSFIEVFAEEIFSVLALEEWSSPPTLREPIWIGINFPEEFVGPGEPPPPPPPPPPPSPEPPDRQIVHVSGKGFNLIEAEGCEVVECITTDDVRCLVESLRIRSETEEVKSWTKKKLAGEKGETPRAKVLLREVQRVPSIDPICGSAPLARVALFGAAAISDGLDVRVAAHCYSGSGRVDRVLIVVRADGIWHYADPNGSMQFGHALPFASVRFYEPARRREVQLPAQETEMDQRLRAMVDEILVPAPVQTAAIVRTKPRIPGIWLVLVGVLIGVALVGQPAPPKRRRRRRRRT